MVIDRNRKYLLGTLLTNNVLVKNFIDFMGGGKFLTPYRGGLFLHLFTNYIVTKFYTLITDEHRGTRD
jgi:hypothetical protein